MSRITFVKKRLYSRCRMACSMPPMYWSTGSQRFASAGSNGAVALNKTGVYLWIRLKDGATEAELIAGLLEKYDGVTEEKAAADVKAFLEELRSRSLLSED